LITLTALISFSALGQADKKRDTHILSYRISNAYFMVKGIFFLTIIIIIIVNSQPGKAHSPYRHDKGLAFCRTGRPFHMRAGGGAIAPSLGYGKRIGWDDPPEGDPWGSWVTRSAKRRTPLFLRNRVPCGAWEARPKAPFGRLGPPAIEASQRFGVPLDGLLRMGAPAPKPCPPPWGKGHHSPLGQVPQRPARG
jgi:hypothetical protein